MESMEELESMSRDELRDFLNRHNVPSRAVPRAGRYIRKEEYLEAARQLRVSLDKGKKVRAEETPLKDDQKTLQRNPFQRDSPTAATPVRSSGGRAGKSKAQELNAVQTPEQPPKAMRRKRKQRRRSSVGWIAPEVLTGLQEGKKTGADTSDTPASKDEGTASDYAQSEPEVSGHTPGTRESEGTVSDADSTVSTDVEEDDSAFGRMRVAELRRWMRDHGLRVRRGSKKAELISIAKAHETYLQARQGVSKKSSSPSVERKAPLILPKPTHGRRFSAPGIQVMDDDAPLLPRRSQTQPKPPMKSGAPTRQRPLVSIRPNLAQQQQQQEQEPQTLTQMQMQMQMQMPAKVQMQVPAKIQMRVPTKSHMRMPTKTQAMTQTRVRTQTRVQTQHRKQQLSLTSPEREKARSEKRRRQLRLPVVNTRVLTYLVGTILLVVIVLWAIRTWRVSRWPFCDRESKESTLEDGRPCRPCPDTPGTCIEGKLVCNTGYRRVRSRCVPDERVSHYAMHLAAKASRILGERAGRAECGRVKSSDMRLADLEERLRPDVKVADQKHRRWRGNYDLSRFDDAFKLAVGLLEEDKDIEISGMQNDVFRSKAPIYPVSCVLQRFTYKHIQGIFWGILVLVILGVFVKRRRDAAVFNAKVSAAVDLALDHLIDQRRNALSDLTRCTPAYLIDTHLREEVLGRVTREKLKIWAAVENELKFDTRVARTKGRIIFNQPTNTWEWRGRLRSTSTGSLTGSTPTGYMSTPGGYSSVSENYNNPRTPEGLSPAGNIRRTLYPMPSK